MASAAREFVSLESLARVWQVDVVEIRNAADTAGVLLFTLQARAHADKSDVKRLGEVLDREAVTET